MLFPVQKQGHMELCQKHLTRYKKEGIGFLQQTITINETWVCDFETEFKSQGEVWKGKKFTKTIKIPTSSFEGEINDNNGL